MEGRVKILRITVIILTLAILGRLFYLQLMDDRYKVFASNNVLRHEVQYPMRGEVFDRNGEYLVQSREAYDLMVVPRDIKGEFDTMLLCGIIGVSRESFDKQMTRARTYSSRRPSVLLKQLPKEVKLKLDEYNFKGFYTQYRTVRSYPRKIAGNLLGYVGEVNQRNIDNDQYYRSGDYIGQDGIEKSYENVLRGEKGVKMQLVDVLGIVKGSYMDGALDTLAVPGLAITATISAELQQLAEELLEDKVGSVVAIEPATGEILVMASSPTYDPDLLIGRDRGNNIAAMYQNLRRPLYNRAVKAPYPPGSTFKIVNALIALQEGIITPQTSFPCNNGYHAGRFHMACHPHSSPVNLYGALQTSCNAYFCYAFRNTLDHRKFGGVKDGFDVWYDYVRSFGFGRRLDSDFTGENNGTLPTRQLYDRMHNNRWSSLSVVSIAIGQGELGTTPLQMANFIATVANRGYYYAPHVVKAIEGRDSIDARFYERHYSKVDKKHFDMVAEAMWRAVHVDGTARGSYIQGFDVCGKTGTAENSGRDHSTFGAFAPKDDPKIAILVYIENAGFGAQVALPVAKLIMEKHLTGSYDEATYERVRNMKINYPAYDKKR